MLPVDEVVKRYETDLKKALLHLTDLIALNCGRLSLVFLFKQGLVASKAQEFLDRDGPNSLSTQSGTPWWKDVRALASTLYYQ